MKKLITGIVFATCVFSMVGWGSAPEDRAKQDKGSKRVEVKSQKDTAETKLSDSRKGFEHADEKRQKDLEQIKRSRGEGSGRKNLHTYGSVEV